MPSPVLKSLADKAGISLDKAEEYWSKAKELAAKQGRKDDYAYIVGIVKKMMGLDESRSHVLEIIDQMSRIQKIDITYQDDSGNIKVKSFRSF